MQQIDLCQSCLEVNPQVAGADHRLAVAEVEPGSNSSASPAAAAPCDCRDELTRPLSKLARLAPRVRCHVTLGVNAGKELVEREPDQRAQEQSDPVILRTTTIFMATD